ncbi:hypothetical protein BKA80DRAFT_30573 [Phyllosticta citrichinensis]
MPSPRALSNLVLLLWTVPLVAWDAPFCRVIHVPSGSIPSLLFSTRPIQAKGPYFPVSKGLSVAFNWPLHVSSPTVSVQLHLLLFSLTAAGQVHVDHGKPVSQSQKPLLLTRCIRSLQMHKSHFQRHSVSLTERMSCKR